MKIIFFVSLIKSDTPFLNSNKCKKNKTENLGERQKNRVDNNSIINLGFDEKIVLNVISKLKKIKNKKKFIFGQGGTAKKFIQVINRKNFWLTSRQKHFAQN